MNLLCFTNLFPPHVVGGYELACYEVLRGLAKRNHKVRVVTTTLGEKEEYYNDNGIEVRRLIKVRDIVWPQPRAESFSAYIKQQLTQGNIAKREIRQFSPDLIYVWSLSGLATNVLKEVLMAPQRCVFSLADSWLTHYVAYWNLIDKIDYAKDNSFGNRLLSLVKNPLYYTLAKLLGSTENFPKQKITINYAQFVSFYLKFLYKDFLSEGKKWEVIYNGVDCEKFSPPKQLRRGGKKRLLYVGRISIEKGVDTLIKALEMVKDEDFWEYCTLVGKERNIFSYLNLSKKLADKLTIIGHKDVQLIPKIMQEHDILIFPSKVGESFGMVAIEAMACGLPVIGSGVGGSREVVIDGCNGLEFSIAEPQDLANKIKQLCCDNNLYYKLSTNAREDVLKRFSLKRFIDESEELLMKAYSEK